MRLSEGGPFSAIFNRLPGNGMRAALVEPSRWSNLATVPTRQFAPSIYCAQVSMRPRANGDEILIKKAKCPATKKKRRHKAGAVRTRDSEWMKASPRGNRLQNSYGDYSGYFHPPLSFLCQIVATLVCLVTLAFGWRLVGYSARAKK